MQMIISILLDFHIMIQKPSVKLSVLSIVQTENLGMIASNILLRENVLL